MQVNVYRKEFALPVKFFWERWHRAVQIDMANKLNGKHTKYWIEADEWVEAFKKTLSKSKQNEFDKEWRKLEQLREDFANMKKGSQPTCF